MYITEEKFESIVQIVKTVFPNWLGFNDEKFFKEEIEYKRKAVTLAQSLLNKSVLENLLENSNYTEFLNNIEKVGHSTNLLYLSTPKSADLSIIYQDKLDKKLFCNNFYNLLHSAEGIEVRLNRYLSFVESNKLPNQWTFPTYFLYLLNPDKFMFVKPRAIAWFLKYIDGNFKMSSKPSFDTFNLINEIVHELKEKFESYNPNDLIDIQSIIWRTFKLDTNSGERIYNYLFEFKDIAQHWFNRNDFTVKYYNFFQEFIQKEKLENADWDYFQKLGDNIHSFQSLAIAKGNALGNLNHPIEHYRNSFLYLVYSEDDLETRIKNFINDEKYKLKYFGDSALSEILGNIFAHNYVFFNNRDEFAASFLKIKIDYKRGDKFTNKFFKYNNAIEPIKSKYLEIVGKQTDLPINIEIDQFFSYLYETYRDYIEMVSSNEETFQPSDIKGPKILKYFDAILEILNSIGGQGTPKEICELVYKNLNIAEEEIKVTNSKGGLKVYNQINWARNYLKEAGYIDSSKRGLWILTEKGRNKKLSDNELMDIFKSVHDKFTKKLPTEDIDIHENQELFDEIEEDKENYWIISPGQNARLWNDFTENKICAIGWNDLGDLSKYKNLDEIKNMMKEIHGDGSSYVNDGLACFEFVNKLKIDDYLFAKKGRNKIIGFGKVSSDFFYDENRSEYKNCRKVEWTKIGEWKTEENHVVKTLTNITKYDNYVKNLINLVNGVAIEPVFTKIKTEKNIWWLNANPKIWSFAEMKIGESENYTSYNKHHSKRRIFKNFQEVRTDDLLIGYITSPENSINGLCKVTDVTRENNEVVNFQFVKVEHFNNPISWSELKSIPDLNGCEPLINNQGSLFKVTNDEYEIIRAIIDEKNLEIKVIGIQKYSVEDALHDLFIDDKELQDIINMLKYKKNIILQGAPGVGKTFIAKRIAFCMMGEKDKDRVRMIQFHQSYSYEDFIQGYRPTDDGGFERMNGIFYEFCKKAQRNPDKSYFFIIDEINRGNLSKIFGELMMLIEKDKRGQDFAIPLTYSKNDDENFYLPDNLYFIGTMNTADRSLAMVDYALRRRFGFITLHPAFKNPKYKEHLLHHKVPDNIIKIIHEKMQVLNSNISKDTKNLGEGYQIGHSYFCPDSNDSKIDENWYFNIIKNEIEPLLLEYWFDNPDKVRDEIQYLLEI